MKKSTFLEALIAKEGRTVINPRTELEKGIMGVPIRPLFLQRVLGTDVLPLSKITEFAGPTGSGKSALAFLLMREFLEQNCDAVLIETENKFNPQFFNSVLGDVADDAIVIPGCTTLEKAQSAILNVISAMCLAVKEREKQTREWENSKKKDKGPKPEQVRPLILVMDSLATKSEETGASIDKEGKATRSYPIEALLNSNFYTVLPDKLASLPIVFIYTNHRMKPVDTGGKFSSIRSAEARSKGGDTPAFYASLRLFFEEAGTVQEVRNGLWSQNVCCKTIKNSFNQKGTRCAFDMKWTNVVNEEEGTVDQVTWFDFASGLIKFLAPSKPGFSYDRESVKKFLVATSSSLTKYSCKGAVNIEGSPEEVGKAIEADPVLCWKLAPYIGVRRFNAYPGLSKPHVKPVKEEEKVTEEKDKVTATKGKKKKEKPKAKEEPIEESSIKALDLPDLSMEESDA